MSHSECLSLGLPVIIAPAFGLAKRELDFAVQDNHPPSAGPVLSRLSLFDLDLAFVGWVEYHSLGQSLL